MKPKEERLCSYCGRKIQKGKCVTESRTKKEYCNVSCLVNDDEYLSKFTGGK